MATTKVGGGGVDLNSDNTSFKMPVGSSLYSGTPLTGMIRNNSSLSNGTAQTTFEYYDGTQWVGMSAPPLPDLEVDFLVVAGGGGGGGGSSSAGCGGGAGGLRTSYGSTSGGGSSAEPTFTTLTRGTNYTLTVGAGGAASTNGSNSVFDTITSIGGGKSGNRYGSGGTGGSGGGGRPIGYGTSNQGFNGGITNSSQGGGGGGAASVGGNGGSSYGGGGGGGLAVNILNDTNATTASIGEVSGTDVYYAGGGGGTANAIYNNWSGGGGIGGGGDGNYNIANIANATANTGGGGGNSATLGGGNGGSGIVILRYPAFYNITASAGITQANGSPFLEGTDKVSVFTGGTGTISF